MPLIFVETTASFPRNTVGTKVPRCYRPCCAPTCKEEIVKRVIHGRTTFDVESPGNFRRIRYISASLKGGIVPEKKRKLLLNELHDEVNAFPLISRESKAPTASRLFSADSFDSSISCSIF